MRNRLFKIAVFLFVSVLVCQLITNYFVFLIEVQGTSMEDTILEDDVLVVSRINKIERGDIIVCIESNQKIIKRCVAVPGDTVQITDSTLYVNNEIVSEPYIKESSYKSGLLMNSTTLKENEYIVLGDNRNNSRDSRTFGVITGDYILGVVIKKIRGF